MPDPFITHFHQHGPPCVIAMTGGGISALHALLSVPGASRTVLEAVVPYAPPALDQWLGKAPDQYCSEPTALMMAAVGHRRARQLAVAQKQDPDAALGLGCTASLVSDRPKRGPHRCHVAVHSSRATAAWSLELEKGARDRSGEDALVGQMVLMGLGWGAAFEPAVLPKLSLRDAETIQPHEAHGAPLMVDLAQGLRDLVWSKGKVLTEKVSPAPVGILCGSFNPLHQAHKHLQEFAARKLGGPVAYELSIRNADKPPLDFLTIAHRVAQFGEAPLALTNAATFNAKSRLLPNTTFVVGFDTAERIILPKYYGGGQEDLDRAMGELRQNNCHFLVMARAAEGCVKELADLNIPTEFADLFVGVPAEEFREDLSSTELRKAASESAG